MRCSPAEEFFYLQRKLIRKLFEVFIYLMAYRCIPYTDFVLVKQNSPGFEQRCNHERELFNSPPSEICHSVPQLDSWNFMKTFKK